MDEYMKLAADEARQGIQKGDGGPFGAVIVRDGDIVGRGHNMVLASHDPTMHGEVSAIRNACKALGTHDLRGCTLYTTAYPCPMCLSAAMWANIERIYYGCRAEDTAEIGFRDEDFYKALESCSLPLDIEENGREECLSVFEEYKKLKAQRY
ncbi:MAG: nucleoside deaminase [Oscillospiraceae bacterium]|nr:nucleoside deaminase [Oscillospiraceae bacterium]